MNALSPGLASLHAAQGCFRAVLTALSRPGLAVEITADLAPPAGLSVAAAAILLTLTDGGVTVAVPDGDAAMKAWLAFHTGARFGPPAVADFIACAAASPARPKLRELRHGTHDEPEQGATLILDVQDLAAGRRVGLTGPGIATRLITNLPLDDGLFAERAAARMQAPCGVDILLCAGRRVLGLPRGTLIEMG